MPMHVDHKPMKGPMKAKSKAKPKAKPDAEHCGMPVKGMPYKTR